MDPRDFVDGTGMGQKLVPELQIVNERTAGGAPPSASPYMVYGTR